MRRLLIVALATAVLGQATAQTIDTRDYLPLGVFNAWNFAQSDDPDDVMFAKTFRVDLVDGVLEYRIKSPFIDSLKDVRLTFAVDGDELQLVRMFFQDNKTLDVDEDIDSVTLKAITFDPPLVLGDASTEVGVDSFVNDVNTFVFARVKAGPFKETVKATITGTITSLWLAPDQFPDDGDSLPFPIGGAADKVDWRLLFDLTLTGEIDDDEEQLFYVNTTDVLLAEDIGPLVVTDPNSSLHVLQNVIAPGDTQGAIFDAAPPLAAGVDAGNITTPGLFWYQDGVDAPLGLSDANVVLDDLVLEHRLNGRAFLRGTASTTGEGGEQLPFEMKGRIVCNAAKGTAKLGLKGKLKGLFDKPLILAAKATLAPGVTTFPLRYKSGKEIVGEFAAPIASKATGSVSFFTDQLVDTKFKIGKARKLGTEGTFFIGPDTYAVTWTETRKTPEEKPSKHSYTLSQTGVKGKLARFAAVTNLPEVEEGPGGDFELRKFSAKLFGGTRIKYKPDDFPGNVVIGID